MFTTLQIDRVTDTFSLGFRDNIASEACAALQSFVRENKDKIQKIRSHDPLPDSEIARLSGQGKFIVGFGDRLVNIPVREAHNSSASAALSAAYNRGILISMFYLVLDESLRKPLVRLLDSNEKFDHDVSDGELGAILVIIGED